MTEEEAKEKWCPMAAALESGTSQKCIGSECMAWVWDKHITYDRKENITLESVVNSSTSGHCGMVK